MKRRDILRAGASSLAFAGMMGAAAPQAAASAATPFAWSHASALALVGQQFWLNHPELRAIGITLAEVQTPATQDDPRLRQFSLVFASDGARFAAGTYEIDHATLGRFLLFVAPAGNAAGAPRYRADFSLMA
ncbi:DUF6916 family protein [Massilia aquatica]|uniref:DUF6916 domain-containing protein n=1 Tax=Massilia aquatica TaxID=2609000 RepID=A0ABX0MCU4_9BURK|nr:hypothetical protein [Massilia aquatica]NHZ42240.1 hypothetical protein [Massilia aquatica]